MSVLHRSSRLLLTFTVAVALSSPRAHAQIAYQVADLGAPPTYHWDDWFGTNRIVEANGLLFFYQNDGVSGRELWRSDGTTLGTYPVRDLCPGSCGSRFWSRSPLAAVGDRVYFAANDGVHGLELWVTDGSALGTRMVLDLAPGWSSSFPQALHEGGDQLFFFADSPEGGRALFRSDGTAKGTYRVSPSGMSFGNVVSMHESTGFLFLCSETGLHRSDGTPEGTFLLAPVPCSQVWFRGLSSAALLPDGSLIFAGDDEATGSELWRSDGTIAGTGLVLDLNPGAAGSSPRHLWRVGGEILFIAFEGNSTTLRRSDGTAAGTVLVPLPAGTEPYPVPGLSAADDSRYYFGALDADHGLEPWVFDGVSASRLADVAPGPASSLSEEFFNDSFFAALDGFLLFSADDGLFGREIWRSDGTGPGTYRVSDLGPGVASMDLLMWDTQHEPTVIGDRFYFFEETSSDGYRFSRTDGSASGPTVIRVIDAQSSAFVPVARDRGSPLETGLGRDCFAGAGESIYFDLERPASYEHDLWRSDGSSIGTEVAYAGAEASYPFDACDALGERLLFIDRQPDLEAVRAIDSTSDEVVELFTGVALSTFPEFLPVGGGLVFAADTGMHRSDGTPEGTTLALEANGSQLSTWSDSLLVGGSALLRSQEKTTTALDLTAGTGVEGVDGIAPLAETIVFTAWNASTGVEFWRSDGGEGDANLISEIFPGPLGGIARPGAGIDFLMDTHTPLVVGVESYAVAPALHPTYGSELWVTDGTALGTHLLKDIYPGEYPSSPRNLTRFGDRVFFTAESELEGLELWATDGTNEGTVLVKDIAPGAASSLPDDLVVRDGVLYFSAWSPSYGREAWKSDGTSAGTIRITDIAPGPKSSSPQRFARVGNRLFFSATDHVHGYELWAISDDGSIPLFLDGFENESTSRWSATTP
jgi:ELWxxDGT repeat protein